MEPIKPLTVPMKTVIRVLADKKDPINWYSASKLRFIFDGLERRGLIRRLDDANRSVALTPNGRNYVTSMRREGW